MPQVIPGGRPRSSSDGDILDEGLCGTLFVNLNDRNFTEGTRKASNAVVNINNNNNSTHNLNSSYDTFDSDSKLSSRSQSSAKLGSKGLTFKSMRKAVSRVFVKDAKLVDSSVKKYEKTSQANGTSKVWTPNLRYLGERVGSKSSSSELSYSGTLSTTRPLMTYSKFGIAVPKWKITPGSVGIYNHGNNCFMNAVLQCLSHIDSFTEYFIQDFFKNDLKNSANGKKGVFRSSHGEVTEQLGNLLKCLWSGKYSSEISKQFKTVVGKFNNQYKGDDQQDAQEFLLWLLDCIHEDVSSFVKKKVKPQKAPVVMTDKELASEAASANGDSFILKLYQALHSSTLTCPTCGERSSTFDPYLCVSLPLPQRYLRVIYVIVVYLDFQDFQEVKMAFILNQNDGIIELREHVAADAKIQIKQLLLVQLKDDCFGATYSDEQPLSDIQENDVVYALETYPDNVAMQSSAQEYDSLTSQLLVIHVEVADKSTRSYRFGSPVMLKVRRDITLKSLQMEVLKKMEDSVSQDVFTKTQKLNSLFLLRVHDGRSRKFYLPADVEMPLYSQFAERAYTSKNDDYGPPHIKIIAEWEPETKSRVVVDDQEHIENSPSVAKVKNSPPDQGRVSLEECFRLYTQEERLIGDDAWLCPYCKQQQQGTIKTLGLWSLPEILILHLKRFKQTGPRRSKLNTLIDFPTDSLDMSSHLSHRNHGHSLNTDDYIYDLVGVSNHYGNMMGGHYTAYCRSPIDGKWREFNDAKVRILDGSIATKEAYILFYQRRSLTKHVNQRLFAGDHWIFSLSQTPSEDVDESSTVSQSSNLNIQSRNSRSRSASPSTRRQNNKSWNTLCIPTYSLTPQPVRRQMLSYANGKSLSGNSSPTSSPSLQNGSVGQRSRSKQRQSSESRSQFTHETFAQNHSHVQLKDHAAVLGNRVNLNADHIQLKDHATGQGNRVNLDVDHVKLKDHAAVQGNRINPVVDHEEFVPDHSKKTIKSNVKSGQPHTSIKTTDIDHPHHLTENRNEPHGSNELYSTTSKSSSSNTSLYSGILKPHVTTAPSSSNAVSALQMKQSNRKLNTSPKSYQDSPPSQSDSESASRKLAHIMKQDIINRAGIRMDTSSKDKSNTGRKDYRINDSQNRLDLSKVKHSKKDNDSDVSTTETSNGDHNHYLDNFVVSDTKRRDNGLKQNRIYTDSMRFDHRIPSEGSELSQDLPAQSSETRQNLQNTRRFHTLHKPAEKYSAVTNGLPRYQHKEKLLSRFADDTAILNSEPVSLLKGDLSYSNKSATISRTVNTSQAGRFERTSIPHSNTDHDIHYSNSSLGPPPSPTPPHGVREEQTFTQAAVSSWLPSSNSDYYISTRHQSDRETNSQNSHELARQHSGYQNSLTSTGNQTLTSLTSTGNQTLTSLTSTGNQTLTRHNPYIRENRYNFRPPREMSVVKIQPVQQNIGNVSTPCLRESSV